MKPKPLQKSVYNIAAVVFLVLALSVISIITSITNRNSDQLSAVVTDLTENKYEIDKVDEAIQLLYKAENNSRLYVLTRDEALYADYMDQLNRVSTLIISVQKDDEQQIDRLVKDKKLKTELYIQAKLLSDSLLRDRKMIMDLEHPPQYNQYISAVVESADTSSSKKVVEEYVVEAKSKRRLFGRIKDAIANKSNEKELKRVTTVEKNPLERKEEEAKAVVAPPLKSIQYGLQPDFNTLTEKEKSLLFANRELFEELKNLLENLKIEEINIHNQQQLDLGNNAATLMGDLKNNTKYYLILSLILTAVILSIMVLLYRNMKALQKAKLAAEEYAKYKSSFIATLSHEMRTPLHSIHAFTDELTKKNTSAEESEVINAIKLSSNMLISVVNNILDFTKMEKGKFKLNHLPFIPSTIIHEVILGLGIQAKRKNLTLTYSPDSSTDERIYGDAFHFRQILVNIIGNAIKYTEEGTISIDAHFNTTDQITGILEFSVKDSGIGISEERIPHIFDEYSSQNSHSEIREGSTGLGLSIVKRIVDYHKGNIHITSEIGEGTTFTIRLPFDIFLENKFEPRLSATNKSVSEVLIVENDSLNLKILNLLFVNEDYIVSNATNGLEAFEMYKKGTFDVVITDISMPGLNGYELARKIRELPDVKKSTVPIIAISGFEAPEKQDINQNSDINAWFVKPFDTNLLISKVEELCNEEYQIS